MGSVSRVYLQADAYLSCITHALSNESEEVMGLCIGEMVEKVTGCEIHISAVMLLRRMDKRKDRVEISVEQLSNASTHAEELAKKSGKPLRIVGWYHSHPHITVWPSHVDVQTQAMYQMMDQSFVGLIFSCFNENKANMQTIEATCFQSARESPEWDTARYQRIEIPMQIERGNTVSQFNFQTLTNLPKILIQEESEMYDKACGSCGDGVMTQIHNASVHAQSLCNITETITSPLLHVLEATNKKHEMELERIKLENEELKQQIAALSTELEIQV